MTSKRKLKLWLALVDTINGHFTGRPIRAPNRAKQAD